MLPDVLIQNFVKRMVALYGGGAMTSNVHHLLHVGKVVTKLGLLWDYSTFVLEGGNRRLHKVPLKSWLRHCWFAHKALTQSK